MIDKVTCLFLELLIKKLTTFIYIFSQVTLAEIGGLSCDSFETLLDFIYDGRMRISRDTVFDVLSCSCYLQIESGIQVC